MRQLPSLHNNRRSRSSPLPNSVEQRPNAAAHAHDKSQAKAALVAQVQANLSTQNAKSSKDSR